MAEQGNLFEKLDEIKSGIDDIKPAQKMSEAETIKFIKTAQRVFVYNGQRSEFNYQFKSWRTRHIFVLLSLLFNIVLFMVALLIYKELKLLWIFFGVLAALNLCQAVIVLIFIIDKRNQKYEIEYNDFFLWKSRYFYDDNGIVYDAKLKLPLIILKIAVIVVNYLSFICLFSSLMVNDLNIIPAVIFSVLLMAATIIIQLRLYNHYGYYTLYFRDENNTVPYYELSDFMAKHNLK